MPFWTILALKVRKKDWFPLKKWYKTIFVKGRKSFSVFLNKMTQHVEPFPSSQKNISSQVNVFYFWIEEMQTKIYWKKIFQNNEKDLVFSVKMCINPKTSKHFLTNLYDRNTKVSGSNLWNKWFLVIFFWKLFNKTKKLNVFPSVDECVSVFETVF